jgi:hypothetical protein
MKHPNQETLALHAGGDLGWLTGWRTARHVAKCGQCATEVAAFEDVRDETAALRQFPEIQWNRLAAEMQANIRLGVAAGECVREAPPQFMEQPAFRGMRAGLAMASIVALLVTGVVLERPTPAFAVEPVVQATSQGIQRSIGKQGFTLMNVGAQNVTYTVSAKGSVGARYVDPETDQVTMTKVYVE